MEREATMSWRVTELERQLESARHESQDFATERVKFTTERVTTAEQGLNVVKVHLVETKEVLQKSLETLETEQKA
jgi:hypothetical protein